MNRREYLDALAGNLEGKCSGKQKNDILSNYSDFFRSGLKDGKSEEELASEFGPAEQATELLSGRGGFFNAHPGVLCAVLGALDFVC